MKKLKNIYVQPEIVIVQLDNAISLALESLPPYGPEESFTVVPDNRNDNPIV